MGLRVQTQDVPGLFPALISPKAAVVDENNDPPVARMRPDTQGDSVNQSMALQGSKPDSDEDV